MKDAEIVDLYWARDERAIAESQSKYGETCRNIAFGITKSAEDAEECENSMYLRAWGSMPLARPEKLGSFLYRIVRNLAIDYSMGSRRKKRGSGQIEVLLDEIAECIAGPDDASSGFWEHEFSRIFDDFLGSLGNESRIFFVQRYWYGLTDQEIAEDARCGVGKIKMNLCRSCKRLNEMLEEGGVL